MTRYMDWNALQIEMNEWQDKNFGNRKPHQPLLGIIEELGELNESNKHEDVIDSIGDTMIFMADYCSQMGIKLNDVADFRIETYFDGNNIISIAGNLCHSHLKLEQKIRGTSEQHLLDIVKYLRQICAYLREYTKRTSARNFGWVVRQTWREVKKRDWTKNKITGNVNLMELGEGL